MSGQHTQGRLEAHPTGILRICFGDCCAPVAEIRTPYRHGIGIVKGEHEAQANARRLAACWNACEGIDQETFDMGWTALSAMKNAHKHEEQAAVARGELAAALARIETLEVLAREQDVMLGQRPCLYKRCMDMSSARELLADAADTFDEILAEDHEIADRIRTFLGGATLPAGAPP